MRPSTSKQTSPASQPLSPTSPTTLRRDEDGWYNAEPPPSISAARSSSAMAIRSSSSVPLRPPSNTSVRPQSSIGVRTSHSGPVRPGSSVSTRPPSSASTRPPSSASALRPGSSASALRPGSSASARRPVSRFSHRAPTRQSSRLLPFYESLVSQVTGMTSAGDNESFRSAVEHLARSLDSTVRPPGSSDLSSIDAVMKGYAKKARINSNDNLAEALDRTYAKLRNQAKGHHDLDDEIHRSRIPDHLKFLVSHFGLGFLDDCIYPSLYILATFGYDGQDDGAFTTCKPTSSSSRTAYSLTPVFNKTLMSAAPAASTLDRAEDIIYKLDHPLEHNTNLTWKDIFAEEPFEGQHWEGAYGLPPGSIIENWETRSVDSDTALSLSPWGSEEDLHGSGSSVGLPDVPETPPPLERPVDVPVVLQASIHPLNAFRHRQDVEELQARQYWRPEWRPDAAPEDSFNIGNAWSLAPTLHRVLGSRTALSIDGPGKENYRHEADLVREVLTGLQGRRNIMFAWNHSGPDAASFVLSPTAPRLSHLTAGAQSSIMSAFASTATTLVHLRKFTAAIFAKASTGFPQAVSEARPAYLAHTHRRCTRTLEAFADAVDAELRLFDTWCARREEDICRARAGLGPKLVVSLLSLEKAVRDAFGASFAVLLDIVRGVVRHSQRLHAHERIPEVWTLPDLPQRAAPATATALLLDALLASTQEHVSMGDTVTARALVRVFGASAEPVWGMVHRWMRDGMPVRDGMLGVLPSAGQVQSPLRALPDEFFVEDNEMVMVDPDFWAAGFALRDARGADGVGGDAHIDAENRPGSVPIFLGHVAELVLATGKVTGLLRVLDVPALFEGERVGADKGPGRPWMADWRSFRMLLERRLVRDLVDGTQDMTLSAEDVVASSENLSRIVYDELRPYSDGAHAALTKVLVDDCDLWWHLNAMEDLFLMRRGDAMSHFVDILFTRMDTRQPWNDFHFMNTAFQDVVALYPGRARWIDAALVRFSFPPKTQGQERSIAQTIRALDGLLIEYAVPFPLTYVFGPRTMRVYSSIFTLVLQVRRAKSVLEKILVRGGLVMGKQLDAEMKVFYAMRGRLSWFVNTLLNFITTNVLHTQLLRFHDAFQEAKSLDDMIRLQNEHLDKLEGRCLLQRNTVALHRTIMSILDMSLHYAECFVSFAGDTTHDISRNSLRPVSRRHRSRRMRKQRRDVIGFAHTHSLLDGGSDSVSEDEDELDEDGLAGRSGREPSFSLGMSTTASFMEDGFLARLDKMSSELDALVRFVRRGVESLAAGTGEGAPAFRIFAFALEDWDR